MQARLRFLSSSFKPVAKPLSFLAKRQVLSIFSGVMALCFLAASSIAQASSGASKDSPVTGKAAYADWKQEQPGLFRKITPADLPPPHATKSVDNGPDLVPRPNGTTPKAPPGFKVEIYAEGLNYPREIRTAPNGDLFLAESHLGQIKVFRGMTGNGKAQQAEVFASGLRQPFGIAFYPPGPDPQWVYVGNTDSVVRFPYHSGDLRAHGSAHKVADLPGGGHLRGGGHWTRDIAFSKDGKKMYVSVGSHSNNDDPETHPEEKNRADILEFNPDGSGMRIYAAGLRNAVGIAVQPRTGVLWASTNERDELGDDLPPDYITHVEDGGFYGWPWFYIGGHWDPKHQGKHPELKNRVIVPDVLVQPHMASLEMTFYDGRQFPREYEGDIFAAEHGSWNRSRRTGYEVVRVPLKNGKPTAEFEDFLTGFVTENGRVWGRPVGVAVGTDGSLFVSDDGARIIWRVSYESR
jgi:glucose/arabinose dehydrogenase